MNLQQQKYRLGLFVIASAALLGVLTVMFGGMPNFLTSRHRYFIVFSDAPGVVKGTPVRRSGVRIGEVEAVDLDDKTGQVRVRVLIDKKYVIRTNEEPTITPNLLSRDTTIDFIPVAPKKPHGPQSRTDVVPARFVQNQPPGDPEPIPPGEPVPPGSVIPGRVPPDVRAFLREAQQVIPSAQQSIDQIRRSVERFEKVAPILEDTLREYTELSRTVREAVPEVRRTNDDLRALVQSGRALAPEVRKTLDETQLAVRNFGRVGEEVNVFLMTNRDRINRIVEQTANLLSEDNVRSVSTTLRNMEKASNSFEKTLTQVQESASKFDSVLINVNQATKPLADRSDRVARNLDESLDQLTKLLTDLRAGLGPIGKGEGSFQRLLNDPAVYNNLNDASLMLTRIMPRLDRILRDLEVFADKIARHPESIGVGGAVRPSAGLKDPPSYPVHKQQ